MTPIVLLSALFFTALTICGALTLAWTSFGRPRHVRSWAIASGLGAAQAAINGIAVAIGRPAPLMLLAFALVVMPGPLMAIGARQRALVRPYRLRFAAAIGAAVLVVALALAVPALRPAGLGSATVFAAVCLVLAARAILPAPGTRRAAPAERAMHATLLLLAAVEAATGVSTWASMTWPALPLLLRIYRGLLAVALPPAVLFSGVAAVLLVASDLAVELGWQAARDPLTGVFNRRGFQDGATRLLASARRLRVPVTLVLADIDHFKAINDAHGHTAGDRTLCFIARQLEDGVRQGDLVARIGGEEFAMLLFDSTADQSIVAIERIRVAIATGFEDDGAPVPVTVSFGIGPIAYGTAEVDALMASALDRADRALYLSKVGGRNRATVAA